MRSAVQFTVDAPNDIVRAFIALCLGFTIISVAVFAHVVSPIFAVGLTFVLVAMLTRWLPEAGLVAVFVAMIFQNVFVAIASPNISTTASFNIIRGYNFIILCSVWSVLIYLYLRYLPQPSCCFKPALSFLVSSNLASRPL